MKKTLLYLLFSLIIAGQGKSQNITAAEYFVDTDPGIGNGIPITITTPGDVVNFTATIPSASLSAGFHFLAIRVKDANGIWSLIDKRGFYISASTTNTADITAAEYFFDADPGHGNGTALSVGAAGATVNFAPTIPASLAPGFHFLSIRVRGSDGIWGLFDKRGFYISPSTTNTADITAAEYFFDSDPGLGNGTALPVGTPGSTVNFTPVIPTALAPGFHFLAIRVKGSDGIWGHFDKRGFYVTPTATDAANITAAEYFFDTDPGVGNGTALPVGSPGSTVNFSLVIPASLAPGFHFLAIRVKGSDGKWGLFDKRGFYISQSTSNTTQITAAEYFINTDPGVGNATPLTINTPGDMVNETFVIPMTSMPEGSYTIAIRVKDAVGKWGLYEHRTFAIGPSTINCPADTSVNTAIGNCTVIVNGIDPAVSPPQPFDYVLTGATTGSGNGTASGLSFNAGVTTVTYKLSNIPSVTCSLTVTVVALPPQITTDPVSQAVCAGGNVTFSATATGSNLNYQWRKNGSIISGATGSSYTINGLTTADAANYDVIVSTPCNKKDTSSAAALTVNTPPDITTQPVSQIVCTGNNVTFSVSATGSGLNYQWRKEGVNISGATGSSYTLNGVTISAAGNYDVVISGICPSPVTSNTVTLTVNTPPLITVQPSNQTACTGTNVTFNVTATGSAIVYQWRKGGVNISGATGNSYTINGITTNDAGTYDVVVSGVCPPTAVSNSVSLTVLTPPAITIQPANQSVCPGTNATFSVTATGSGLTYQWRKGGVNISGATSSSYTINNAAAGDAGSYDVVITGTCGVLTSVSATLTINPVTTVSIHPVSQTVCPGTNVTFNVSATGTGTLTYQWRKGGVNISGAVSSSYNINIVAAGDAGNYDVEVTGTCGTATSNAATLTVNTATAIITQPQNQSSCTGGNVTFTVNATGTGITYQWRKNSVNISGATLSSFTINNVTSGDEGTYDVVVTGTCGTVTSAGASLTIAASTIINTQPVSQSVCPGSNVTFSVSASGSGTITYQWKKNGVNIPGASSSSYTINNVAAADAANYSVDVNSDCGPATSDAATLSLLAATSITTQPAGQSVCPRDNVSFTVTATGTGILTYQWRKNSVNISGATSSSYTITGVLAGDAGSYDVVVTGDCGIVTSSAASLTVLIPPSISVHPQSQAVCPGNNASFSVTAAGTGLTYQWRKGGVNLTGAASATLTINGVTAGDAGSYDVVIIGTCGSVTSDAATLTINTVPSISVQPVSQAVCVGGNVIFSVTASGTGITYQWRKGGVNIGGATSSSYTITGVNTGDAGNYDVVVSGTCSPAATSSAAVLTVNTPPLITAPPVDQISFVGSNVTFTVTATGSGLAYQWRKNGVNIPGATSSSYTITGVTTGDAGNYNVVVSGTCPPAAVSAQATLTVFTVSITTHPSNRSVCAGGNTTFTIAASGANLTYQWQVSVGAGPFTNIAGATSSTLSLNNVTLSMNGNRYRCVVSGSLNSNAATLTVNPLPVVTFVLPDDTIYLNTPQFVLSGGSPAGGTYTGTGISNGIFIPAATGQGTYQAAYNYTDANGCSASATDEFTVLPIGRINIYPNPAKDGHITIIVAPSFVGGTATVYNGAGQKMTSWVIAGRRTSYNFNWASGQYTIIFTFNSGRINLARKIIIIR